MKQPVMTRIAMVLADLDNLAAEKVLASRMPKAHKTTDPEPCGDVCVCDNTCGCADES